MNFRLITKSVSLFGIALALVGLPAIALAAPSMSAQKSTNVSGAVAGNPVVYSIVVQNQGDTVANNVVVTDTLSADFLVTTNSISPVASLGTTGSGQTVLTWNLGSMGAGSSTTLTFTVTTPFILSSSRTIANSAIVTGTNFSSVLSNSPSVTVTQPNPIVVIVKSPSASQVSAGGMLSYTLTATNTGGTTASDVVITDDTGSNLTYISATPTPTTVALIGMTGSMTRLRWVIGSMTPGASFTSVIQVATSAGLKVGDTIFNSANVDGSNIPSFTSTVSSLVVSGPFGTVFNLVPVVPAVGGPADPVVTPAATTLPVTGVSPSFVALIVLAMGAIIGAWLWNRKTSPGFQK